MERSTNPNPFSPSFAILPASFYGRREYIDDYAKALDTPDSAYRFFFLTGTRGSGKTSLLHQYELLAAERGQVKFALPHYELIFEFVEHEEPETSDDEWDY